MKRIFLSCFVLAGLAALASAKVKPVIYDTPLALRPDPTPGAALPGPSPRGLDDWLNIRINTDQSGQVQNEQQVVVNALNANNVVAVWRDFRFGYRRIGVGYSLDGGWTWHDELFPLYIYPWQSDPALTWHSSGAIYACNIYFDPSGEDGLFVSQSTDGGVSWGPFYPAVNGVPDSFEDKELIACDRTGSPYDGNLYVAWTKFAATTDIYCVRSSSGGVTWDDPVQVSDSDNVQWPNPVIGPDGEVCIAWVNFYPSGILFDKSLDGGVTWGTDRLVQPTSFASALINPELLIFAFPAMDMDITNGPHRGYIYIAYSDDQYGDTDIFFTRSTDGGRNWSAPLRVNDDAQANGCDQFHPWLVCDESGILHLIFYDRRNDPVQNLYMDLYYTYSTNGGLNWSPNDRITVVSSNPAYDSLMDSGLIGEYNGLAVRNGVIHPVWTDTRYLNQDTYTAVWDTTTSVPGEQYPPADLLSSGELTAFPRPFNNELHVWLEMPAAGYAMMQVYDVAGRLTATLADGYFAAGTLRRSWRPQGPSGVYLVTARSPAGRSSQKVLYVK